MHKSIPNCRLELFTLAFLALATFNGCGSSSTAPVTYGLKALDPNTAPVASIDRFSDSFATLFKRSEPALDTNYFIHIIPAPNAAFALDTFLVHGLGPTGAQVTYYSLDIVKPTPQVAYKIVDSSGAAIAGQLPILTGVPGDSNYSDFAQITQVTVGAGYVANSIASAADVATAVAAGAKMQLTTQVVNWSVVPKGTTASLKFQGNAALAGQMAWVGRQVAYYAEFETNLIVTSAGTVPTVPIYVVFNNDTQGPPSGFATEPNSVQTHNVVGLLPGQPGYSSYWDHFVNSVANFGKITNLATAQALNPTHAPVIVNCPIVAP